MSGKPILNDVNKKHTEKIHFKKRFKERVGIECSRNFYNEIFSSIKNHRSIFLYKNSNRIFCYLIIINEKKFIIVYDKFRDVLVTLIPEDKFQEEQLSIINNLSNNKISKLNKGKILCQAMKDF
jgi:hypothetical protein